MIYEIKVKFSDNERAYERSYIASEIKFGKQNGFKAVGFRQVGKKRFDWQRIETTKSIKERCNECKELVICEATTGREMYTFNF